MATRAQFLKYTLLPGIIPRISQFVRSGFVHVAYLMAVIYSSIRLLPPNHPYLDPRNLGRFGIRHVIAQAANNLEFNKKNLDQILVFFMLLVGIILLLGQFLVLGISLFVFGTAFAAPLDPLLQGMAMFQNPSASIGSQGPANDLAFMILDLSFGLNGVFDSCVSTGGNCVDFMRDINAAPGTLTQQVNRTLTFNYPSAVHVGLYRMLQFYAYGIFFVAVMVIIYYVITIVAETATTGTPFGQRYNKAWAPVRLIIFLAFLVPITGLSAIPGNGAISLAQLTTFYIAKTGSNVATNAWAYFNNGATTLAGPSTAGTTMLTQQKRMIADPKFKKSSLSELVQFIHIAKTCSYAYGLLNNDPNNPVSIQGYLVRNPPPTNFNVPAVADNRLPLATTGFNAARDFFYNGTMLIRFGAEPPAGVQRQNWPKGYDLAKGNIKPLCGDLRLSLNDVGQTGALLISQGTYELIQQMWVHGPISDSARCIAEKYGQFNGVSVDLRCNDLMAQQNIDAWLDTFSNQFAQILENGRTAQENAAFLGVDNALVGMGWVGASLFYNKIATMNGAITAASMNLPKTDQLPFLLQLAMKKNAEQNANLSIEDQFNTLLSDPTGRNTFMNLDNAIDYRRLRVMRIAFLMWGERGYEDSSNFERPSGNIVIDYLNLVLGTGGLFEMRNNLDVHPLAKLTALGKSMMDASVRNLAIGIGGAVGANAAKLLDQFTSDTLKAASDFFMTMAIATIGMAAVLYYVLPLLPFIYFFFAVSGWVKSIFEAIVAIPLWALAHIRIDGEGLPGPGGTNGYFLLLEVFLRPILILIGFIASVSIFAALVDTLNLVFDVVAANVGGFDEETDAQIAAGTHKLSGILQSLATMGRGPIDEFMFSVLYTAIAYMMGLSCFKLVDEIPNKILRWAGVSVSTFQENAGDPASQLSNQVYKGSLLVGNQIKGSTQGNLAILTS